MKKKESTIIAWLVIIGIFAFLLTSLLEKIGLLWFGLIAVTVLGFVIFYNIHKKKEDQKTFDALALYVLHNRLHPDEAKNINTKLYKSNFARGTLIRKLQIIRDSIEIALTSKKRDTAVSRMSILLDQYEEIKNPQSGLVSTAIYNEIDRVIQDTKNEFQTKLFLNVAMGYIEKAQNLKTKKSKENYLNLAIETLKEGLHQNNAHEAALKTYLTQIEEIKASLE